MSEKKKNPSILKTFFRLLPVFFRASPAFMIFDNLLAIAHGASWAGLAVFQQRLFDDAALLAGGQTTLDKALWSLLLLVLMHAATQVLNGVANYLPDVHSEIVKGKLSSLIHRKMSRLDPVLFEDTDTLTDINKAQEGKNSAYWFQWVLLGLFTFYLPYFIAMGWYLYSLKPVLALSLVIIFVPTALAQLIRVKVFSHLEEASAPVRREYEYYEKCFAGREYFKETRLLGGFDYFKRLYIDALHLINDMRFKAVRKSALFELTARLFTVLGYCGILWMLFAALVAGEISVGAFAAVFANLGFLYGIMEEIVCRHIGSVARDIGTVYNFTRFLDLPERGGAQGAPGRRGDIVFSHVSFSYPHADKPALSDIDFTLREGETLAMVGENGAGKSTLARLITGMYTPTGGSVMVAGRNLRDCALPALRSGLSAVFQKFRKYQLTLRENLSISTGALSAPDDALDSACRSAGLDPRDAIFPDGYDTMLSREMNQEDETGVDLSGGQWQRVAIARAFCREHDLIILDEPTAAIDPIEESRTYDRFAELSKDKTAVIITHRLGSVRLADRILVLDGGRIAESGTHDELMKREGVYARMFEAQRQWYV